MSGIRYLVFKDHCGDSSKITLAQGPEFVKSIFFSLSPSNEFCILPKILRMSRNFFKKFLFQNLLNSQDILGQPRLGLQRNHHAFQPQTPLGRLETDRTAAEKPLQHSLPFHPDHR